MELTLATLYALLAGLGLVAFDSVISSQSVYLEAKTAHVLEEEGYSKEVIDGLFVTQLKKIGGTKSLIKGTSITSSKVKPVSVALAELVNMQEALTAIQTMVGFVPRKVILSAVVEEGEKKVKTIQNGAPGSISEFSVGDNFQYMLVLTGYSKNSGYFEISIESDKNDLEHLDDLIREGAYQIVLKLNPYIAALYKLETAVAEHKSLDPVKAMVEKLIDTLPDTPINADRAQFENLLGLVALLQNDPELADLYFSKSTESNPDFYVARLNRAFVDVHYDRFQSAINQVDGIVQPWYWPATDNKLLLAAAHVIRGVALSGLGRETEAVDEFRYATSINPNSSEAYFYWSHVANYIESGEAAQKLLLKSRQNSAHFENYPEVAMFYFWLSDANNMPLVRRQTFGYR
jgi:tetratricopeptide (TPR) repeat protein